MEVGVSERLGKSRDNLVFVVLLECWSAHFFAGQRLLVSRLSAGGNAGASFEADASAHFLNIGDMHWAIDGFDTAVWLSFGGFESLLDRAAAFDDDFALRGIHEEHGAALTFVIACDDFDLVAFFDVRLDTAHEMEWIKCDWAGMP